MRNTTPRARLNTGWAAKTWICAGPATKATATPMMVKVPMMPSPKAVAPATFGLPSFPLFLEK